MAIGDTGTRLVGNTEFYGGLSTDDKIGIENSFADGECLDVRKSPSQMTVLPQSREIADGGVITGLITAMTQTKDGTIWGLDEYGKLYSITPQNVVTRISGTHGTTSGHGMIYSQQHDALIFATARNSLGMYGPIANPRGETRSYYLSANNALRDNSEYIANSITMNYAGNYISNPDVPRDTDGQIVPTLYDFTVPQSVSETNANKALFLPGLTPINEIRLFIKTKGSGTIKLIIHDKNNNVVGESKEFTASEITANSWKSFNVWRSAANAATASMTENQVDVVPWAGDLAEAGGEYHIHVVASSSGYTIHTVTSGSLYYGMRFRSYASALLYTYNEKHPIAVYKSVYIGNGRYVAELQSSPRNYLDDTVYLPHRLRLDDGFEVCSIATSDEYIVIGAEKHSTDSTRAFQAGKIYFWDGESDGPNFSIECNMGAPHCIYNYANITYVIVNGALYAYTGGKELIKVRTLKGTDTEYSGTNTITDVYPNMITTRREIMLVGFPSTTTAKTIRFGIHGWGSIDKNYPNCFTYNYRIPGATEGQYNTNTQTLRLGCVYNFGDSLYYGYSVNGNPALATVDNVSGASQTFHWVSLCYDAGSPILEKSGLRIGIYFDKLPTGTTITPIYRIDEGDVFPSSAGDVETIVINGKTYCKGPHTAVAGDRSVRCEVNQRIHEFQYGFIGTTNNGMNTPVIKQVCAEVRINNEERKI